MPGLRLQGRSLARIRHDRPTFGRETAAANQPEHSFCETRSASAASLLVRRGSTLATLTPRSGPVGDTKGHWSRRGLHGLNIVCAGCDSAPHWCDADRSEAQDGDESQHAFSTDAACVRRRPHEDGVSVFDYGCGRGDDIRLLRNLGHDATGWDPAHAPTNDKSPAQLVNLGYVINVIEEPTERVETLRAAGADPVCSGCFRD